MPDLRVEYPSIGATYSRDVYGVYEYRTYPRSSVLAGQVMRIFVASYDTEREALEAHPQAQAGCLPGYTPPFLGHLPDDGDDWDW